MTKLEKADILLDAIIEFRDTFRPDEIPEQLNEAIEDYNCGDD